MLISWPPWQGFLCGGINILVIYLICNISSHFLVYTGLWISQIKYSINIKHDDHNCIKGLYMECHLPKPLLIIIYSMMELLICKYEPFWEEVSVEFLILRWPLRPVDLLFQSSSEIPNAYISLFMSFVCTEVQKRLFILISWRQFTCIFAHL